MQTIRTEELVSHLEDVLSRHYRVRRTITRLDHRLSDYCTSFMLEEMEVVLEDGTALSLMLKNVGQKGFIDEAYNIKPPFLYSPLREIETYRSILSRHRLNTAHFFGAVVEPSHSRYWLVLEKVEGPKLRFIGELEVWKQAVRWLADLHSSFDVRERPLPPGQDVYLVKYDENFYHRWMRRALSCLRHNPSCQQDETLRKIEQIASRYGVVAERLASLPHSLIHGDFFGSNILIQNLEKGLRVCVVDWEMAAIGPGLIDLASLTSGTWTDAERMELAMTYYEEMIDRGRLHLSPERFLTALDCCRLHLAIQWLGWSNDWSPPGHDAQDWLSEAFCLSEKLGL